MRRILLSSMIALVGTDLHAQKFYSDDPLVKEPPPRRVGMLPERKLSDYYDLFSNQFATLGQKQPESGPLIHAQGVNTLGEPLQGPWWEARHYYQPMTPAQLKAGPGQNLVPAPGTWTVVSAKNEGVTPGFVILDSQNRRFFIKFDPLSNPEMATASDAIASRFYYAMGYHVPENHVIHFKQEQLKLRANVKITGTTGEPRSMTDRDLTELLIKVPKSPDGSYRATASAALPGRPIGPPRYYGTRSDDPNDIVPHEHRRDQRGMRVIDAWLDHDDSRAINNLDAIMEENGVSYVRHNLLDFGSTLGSGTERANSPRTGSYYFTWKDSAKQLFTLGLMPAYWATANYPNYPSIGKFESKVFDPERWVPEYPNSAFRNSLPDDDFWGAKQVTAFTNDDIRAIVSTGELSDKKAEEWLIECLIQRRDKIGRVYFGKLLPLDRFEVKAGSVGWDEVGKRLGYTPAADVTLSWSDFDNSTSTRTPRTGSTAQVPNRPSGYSVLTLTSKTTPLHRIEVFLRHSTSGAQVVGVDRFW
ncbi:MAG: hypothetical protein ABIR70_07685 [Bryobacteraceae bacterium]